MTDVAITQLLDSLQQTKYGWHTVLPDEFGIFSFGVQLRRSSFKRDPCQNCLLRLQSVQVKWTSHERCFSRSRCGPGSGEAI